MARCAWRMLERKGRLGSSVLLSACGSYVAGYTDREEKSFNLI